MDPSGTSPLCEKQAMYAPFDESRKLLKGFSIRLSGNRCNSHVGVPTSSSYGDGRFGLRYCPQSTITAKSPRMA